MFENGFATRTESAKKCIFPVIHQLDALGDAAYGGRFYDGDMNVLHVNILPNARTNLAATLRTDFLTGEALTDFDKHIQFHVVKYSQAQMNTLQETVRKELMGHVGFGIHEVYYDTKRHKLIIGVDDASEEARGAILNELSRFGYTDADMVAIQNEPRAYTSGVFDFTGDPVDMSHGVPDRVLDAVAKAGVSVKPGSWIGNGASLNSIVGISSICTGFLYNNQPGFLSCGHGKASGQKIFYQPVPSSGSYPSNLWNYSTSNLVEIGQTVAVSFNSGDAYDYASIIRTNSSANMNSKNFKGGTIDGDSGVPANGELMAVCGCADGAVFGECLSSSTVIVVDDTVQKTNMIKMSKPITPGTSGGSVVYQDDESKKINLTGIVTSYSASYSYHAKYSLVKSRFNLTTVY
jgi:hypothetical protein